MTPRKTPSDEQLREAFSEVGDALQRAVVLSSDRVQSVFEDAVVRGRMTRRDAEELASSLVALGRDQAQELRGEVDALARSIPGRVADVVADAAEAVTPTGHKRRAAAKRATAKKSGKSAGSAKRAKPAKDAGATPSAKPASAKSASATPTAPAADPGSRTAKDVIASLDGLSPAELNALRAAESAAKARATVLRAIDAKLTA